MIDIGRVAALARERALGVPASDPIRRYGRMIRSNGEILFASGIKAPIGSRCLIDMEDGAKIPAEVVGFDAGALLMMPEQGSRGITRGARVHVESRAPAPLMGPGLLGRVIDGRGAPLDGRPAPEVSQPWPLFGVPINPMARARIAAPFDVGVSAINALATLGRGMRVGLFAGSGVGKTTLLGMIARHAEAEIVVVGMIGERGREIREFIEDHIGAALSRAVIVASPADETPLGRIHGAYRAAAIAEFWRAQGKHVLLVIDSLTRLAMGLREIGLATGEPPATKGYPASVFGALSAYVERAGNGAAGQGSITAIYTVLVEGDDHVGDPVADTARSVLDGHIVLSRAAAEAGLYPPIDISASLSRPMPGLVGAVHTRLATRFRALWARRQEKQDIIDIGAYAPGRDPLLDEAIARAAPMEAVLRQDVDNAVPIASARALLAAALGETAP